MFRFLDMLDDYDERKVYRHEFDDLIIDTALVNDGNQPYETGIKSPLYNNNEWVIVEAYDTKEQAQEGHNRWVETMLHNPPEELVECTNSFISQFGRDMGIKVVFKRQDKEK